MCFPGASNFNIALFHTSRFDVASSISSCFTANIFATRDFLVKLSHNDDISKIKMKKM